MLVVDDDRDEVRHTMHPESERPPQREHKHKAAQKDDTSHMIIPKNIRTSARITGGSLLQAAALAVGQTLIEAGVAHLRERITPTPTPAGGAAPPPQPPSPSASAERTSPPIVYVYGLVDPRTNQVRYVGASIDPWRRRSEHLSEARSASQSAKALWLRDLLATGGQPQVLILGRTARDDWRSIEERWIASYTNLTNRGAEAPEEDS
jgi:hypothetical protein